jgi:hypothetical protein
LLLAGCTSASRDRESIHYYSQQKRWESAGYDYETWRHSDAATRRQYTEPVKQPQGCLPLNILSGML